MTHDCPTHHALRADVLAILDQAREGRMDDARTATPALTSRYGYGTISAAMVIWCDELLTRMPKRERRHITTWMTTSTPEETWAVRFINARARRDKPATQELLAVPRGPAQVEAHVMALLGLIATHINRYETARSN